MTQDRTINEFLFSKTVAELKLKFPSLSNGLRCILSNEMEKVVREEKFLKEEPDRLESALRRCKKLTGTLVTLKRFVLHPSSCPPVPEMRSSLSFCFAFDSLASVQEQRLPPNEPTISEETPRSADISAPDKVSAKHPKCLERKCGERGVATVTQS